MTSAGCSGDPSVAHTPRRRAIRVAFRRFIGAGRRRTAGAAVLGLLLAGCALQAASPTPGATGPPGDTVLPAAEAFLPLNVPASTPWMRMSSQPSGFDLDVPHASAGDLADAFGAALAASYGPDGSPELGLDVVDETDERALLLISETGLPDDSVAGTQYALVVTREADGWRIAELWTRALCRRGVSGNLCL